MQDESSLAGHVGERAPRSAEDAPDGEAKGSAQRSPEEPEEQFEEVDSSSSQDEGDLGEPSRSSSPTPVPPAEAPDPSGETTSGVGPPEGTGSDPHGAASGEPFEGRSGSGSDAGHSDGRDEEDGGDLGDQRGSAEGLPRGTEANGGGTSALDAFLEGGMDVLAARRPSAKVDRFERYNLEAAVPSGGGAYGEQGAGDQDTGEAPGNPVETAARPKHLSAKQRKLMKQVRTWCSCIWICVYTCMCASMRADRPLFCSSSQNRRGCLMSVRACLRV